MKAITKAIQSIVKCTADYYHRPSLAGIFFKKDKLVATDGYRLIEFPYPEDINKDDYPEINNFKPLKESDLEKGVTIPASFIKKLKFYKSKNVKMLENLILGNIKKDKYGKILEIAVAGTDLESNKIESTRVLNRGDFPDYKSFFKKEGKYTDSCVNPEYMIDVLKVYQSYGITNVKISFSEDGLKPIFLEGTDCKEAKALIMPLKN